MAAAAVPQMLGCGGRQARRKCMQWRANLMKSDPYESILFSRHETVLVHTLVEYGRLHYSLLVIAYIAPRMVERAVRVVTRIAVHHYMLDLTVLHSQLEGEVLQCMARLDVVERIASEFLHFIVGAKLMKNQRAQ